MESDSALQDVGDSNKAAATIQSAYDTLKILRAFSTLPGAVALGDIAACSGQSKSKTHRALATLVRAGFVRQDPETRLYSLDWSILGLASKLLADQDMVGVARSYLKPLATASKRDITLAVRSGESITFVDKIKGGARVKFFCDVGKQLRLHVGAAAKAILAHLPQWEFDRYLEDFEPVEITPFTLTSASELLLDRAETRRRGYSVSNQEVDEGISAVGAAILDYQGYPIAGAAIAFLTANTSDEETVELGRSLQRTTRAISTTLGYQPTDKEAESAVVP